jgi:predicted nucleic acid-binding protein
MAARSLNHYKLPYLDSCVYIAAIKGPASDEPERAEMALRILAAAERQDFKVIASSIVIAEVVRLRRQGPTPLEDIDKINGFLGRSFIKWVEADVFLTTRAQELQRKYGTLKPLDAVHVASALRGGADYLMTWDGVLLDAGITELKVQVPTYQGQEELDIEAATSKPESSN